MKILILTNQLLTTCGVSKHLLYFLTEVKNNNYGLEITIVCGGGDNVDQYQDLCKETITHSFIQHENRSIKNLLKSIWFIFKLQRKNHFDIIHSHNHYAANVASIVSKILKVKTIQSVHGIIDPIGRLKHYPSEYFIAVNEHVKQYLIDVKQISKSKIKIIKNGVAYNDNVHKPNNNKIKIIAAGRLIKIKAFDVYVKAIALLPEEVKSKVEFYLTGNGESKDELLLLIKDLSVELVFLDEVYDLIRFLETTNVLVNPSRSVNEGFPMTIIEAALTKNLIISSNFLGHDSILKDKVNALIFNINDPTDLADKLEYAIENYLSLNQLIENGYITACKEFPVNKMIDKTLSFYKEIL